VRVAVAQSDVVRMREQLLFDGPEASRKLSRFWILLVLAAVIASAGVVGDSTATVIGAMIVAPLMTPILGLVLSIVTGDLGNALRSLVLVVAGAALVVLVGYVVATLVPYDVVAANSSQVAGRIHPRLVDLAAALATGAVGSFALVRADVSDTLPGVAIAISLVPPLAVVGITLEAGADGQARGALLLFLTNVGAILGSGLVVMALYRVRRTALGVDAATGLGHRASVLVVVALVAILVVPLAASSARLAAEAHTTSQVADVAQEWADASGWRLDAVEHSGGAVVVRVAGAPPAPASNALRRALDGAGLESVAVRLILVPEDRVDLPASAGHRRSGP
jgi:uncharacterized hydrophobic protein (TIGR00271 family)